MGNQMRHNWVPIVFWFVLVIAMLIVSWIWPDILNEDSTAFGLLMSIVAWFPGVVVWSALNMQGGNK